MQGTGPLGMADASTVAGYYTLAIVTAVVPWVNAEVVMLSAVPLAATSWQLAALVTAVSLGQMTGKSALYWASRRTDPASHWPRWQRAIERWRTRFAGRPVAAIALLFVSALVGVPPFFAVTLAAGGVRVAFVWFLAAGTIGRVLHFALVALAPHLLGRLS